MISLNAPTEAGLAPDAKFAGFWIRAFAFGIDIAMSMGLAMLLAFVAGMVLAVSLFVSQPSSPESLAAATQNYSVAVIVVISWLYFTVAESSRWQATPGKKLLGLRVVDDGGQRVGFTRANGRYWSKAVSWIILGIGFVMVGLSSQKQGLHDRLAGTFVTRS